jgi:hypothetical protein
MADEKKGINTGGGAHVGGNVTVKAGDFVGRDKITQTVEQGITVKDFTALLNELKQLLPQTAVDFDTHRIIEGDFKVVEDETLKENPNGAVIKGKLKGMMEMLSSAGGALEGTEKIASLLGKALKWTGALFL